VTGENLQQFLDLTLASRGKISRKRFASSGRFECAWYGE